MNYILIIGFLLLVPTSIFGARYPFEPIFPSLKEPKALLSPQDYEVGELTLRAVVWDTEKPVALFETENGMTFNVKIGTKIGKKGGKVTHIGDKMVIVEGPFGKKTFRLKNF